MKNKRNTFIHKADYFQAYFARLIRAGQSVDKVKKLWALVSKRRSLTELDRIVFPEKHGVTCQVCGFCHPCGINSQWRCLMQNADTILDWDCETVRQRKAETTPKIGTN